MCGRYSFLTAEDSREMQMIWAEINRRDADDPRLAGLATGEVFPTHTVPILATARDGHTRPVWMRWGFPRPRGSGVIINARSESVLERPMFRSAFFTRRCVVPSTGFYEWRYEDGRKRGQKMWLRLPNQPMLYMAGLYGFFPDARTPDAGGFTGFVILTTAANGSVAPIHNRMPLILLREEIDPWLRERSAAQALVAAPCEHLLTAVPA